MEIQFSIYRKNKSTGEIIPGSLLIADNDKIIDLIDNMDLYPKDSEFPNINYLKIGRQISFEGERFQINDFNISTSSDKSTLKIKIFVTDAP